MASALTFSNLPNIDVVVHRQLLRALEGRPAYMSNEELQKLAEHINTKHKQAKQVQRDSTALFEVLYFKSHENVEEDAVIVSFKTNGFFVYVPRFCWHLFMFRIRIEV